MNLFNLITQTVETESEFLAAHKHASLPSQLNYSLFDRAVIFDTPPPAHNSITQTVRPLPTPTLTDKGIYEQAWEVVDLPPEAVVENQRKELEAYNAKILSEIAAIESTQSRAVREAALGSPAYLIEIETKIQVLRLKLKQLDEVTPNDAA